MMSYKALIVTALLAWSGAASAMVVNIDLTQPASATGEVGYFADAYQFDQGGVNLQVSGWSSGGDDYNPFGGIMSSRLGVFSDYGMGVEDAGALSHTVDNLGYDFDFLLFEFDREVSLEGFGLSYIENDSDMSIGAFDGDRFAVGSVYDANVGFNSFNSGEFAASTWLIGAFHPLFGLAQDTMWDGFKINEIAVNVNPVPLPAAFWFLATGLLAFGYFRRKEAPLKRA